MNDFFEALTFLAFLVLAASLLVLVWVTIRLCIFDLRLRRLKGGIYRDDAAAEYSAIRELLKVFGLAMIIPWFLVLFTPAMLHMMMRDNEQSLVVIIGMLVLSIISALAVGLSALLAQLYWSRKLKPLKEDLTPGPRRASASAQTEPLPTTQGK